MEFYALKQLQNLTELMFSIFEGLIPWTCNQIAVRLESPVFLAFKLLTPFQLH